MKQTTETPLDRIKEQVTKKEASPLWTAVTAAASGAGGRFAIGVALRPLDVITKKVQDPNIKKNPYGSGRSFIMQMIAKSKQEGVIPVTKDLYSGAVARGAQASSRDFFRLLSVIGSDKWLGSSEQDYAKGLVKAVAVLAIDTIMTPFDTLVVRMAQDRQNGFSELREQYKLAANESKGKVGKVFKTAYPWQVVAPGIPKQFVQAASMVMIGDFLNPLFREKDGSMTPGNALAASLATGAITGGLTHPTDWYKVLAQSNKGEYSLKQFAKDVGYALKPGTQAGTGFLLRVGAVSFPVAAKNLSRLWAQEKARPQAEIASHTEAKSAQTTDVNNVSTTPHYQNLIAQGREDNAASKHR